jgi:hypothetical protein
MQSFNHIKGDKGQVSALVIQATTLACDAEGLARASENDNINWSMGLGPFDKIRRGHVAEIRYMREVVRVHGARERVVLRGPDPVDFRSCELATANAAEQGCAPHLPGFMLAVEIRRFSLLMAASAASLFCPVMQAAAATSETPRWRVP